MKPPVMAMKRPRAWTATRKEALRPTPSALGLQPDGFFWDIWFIVISPDVPTEARVVPGPGARGFHPRIRHPQRCCDLRRLGSRDPAFGRSDRPCDRRSRPTTGV